MFKWCKERPILESEQYREVLPQLPAANADHEDLNEQDKRSKRRLVDLIHSRRKRERMHQELTSIKDEARQLYHEQGVLQNEHKRLEGLLKQANHILREEHSRLEGIVAQAKNDLFSIL
jgi:predicted  nucleic acid-binding Zn-ribbon protein